MLVRLRLGVLRLLRLNATPHGVALGFSLGLALSLFPVPFLGMIVALAVAPLIGASLPAVYAGTAVVNPLTGPAIYFGELWLGGRLTGSPLPRWSEVRYYEWREWLRLVRELLPAFLLGALTMMVVSTALTYPLIRSAVAAYRRRHPLDPEIPGPKASEASDATEGGDGGKITATDASD
ncbi:MAG: DUF2062 domain-containing protein [Enhygromyxa sp.]